MKKNKKVIKMVYGGVTVPPSDNAQAYSSFAPSDNAQAYSSFAPQAPIINTDMSSQVMDDGMSDSMGGYKKGGSVNIGKGKDYIKDLL
jgi:hypothetical protein